MVEDVVTVDIAPSSWARSAGPSVTVAANTVASSARIVSVRR
jgi:hypothetical protein